MQIETQSFQLPQYESALLKKQRQSKVLSAKVTHIYPQIKQIEKLKIKKHHLDDTEVKQALHYDYEQNQQPKQYLFRGNKLNYEKEDYHSGRSVKSPANRLSNTGFTQTGHGILKLNTQYFQSKPNFNKFTSPERDIPDQTNHSQRNLPKNYQTENNYQTTRLKKSISVTDFQSLRRDQQQMQQKVIGKLNQLQNQTDRLSKHLQVKQKSAHAAQPLITRYKSQTKRTSVQKDFNKLKQKLQRQRTKEKQRLQLQLQKIKKENKKIKQEEKRRKKSFKQIIENQQSNKYLQNLVLSNGVRIPAASMRAVMTDMNHVSERYLERTQHDNLIAQKINQLQRNYLPKTNIVNKRIQCQIYDPRTDHLRRLQDKPRFLYNQDSDTDSQFSDF